MGYTTDFDGRFNLDRPLTPEHAAYLRAFNETRRMKRDAKIAESFSDPVRTAVGLPIGDDGAYFVGNTKNHGQDHDKSVIEYNDPPGSIERSAEEDWIKWYALVEQRKKEGKQQPGLWCQWTVGDDNQTIEHDGGEKFYDYIEWLRYIINHFIAKWGYVMNGEVAWQGEDTTDIGKMIVNDNVVTVKTGKIVYE